MNNKIYGVLDVGSNSVRALVYSDGKILYSGLITSRLGEGLAKTGELSSEAIIRTYSAVKTLTDKCSEYKTDKIFVFATEAVRSAKNGEDFCKLLREDGIETDVLSGDEEGEIGLLGALGGKDGGIIDIGGASAEIVVAKGGKIIYSHSLPLGAVRLTDTCGEDENLLYKTINGRISEYGNLPEEVDFKFIGGTATALATVNYGIKNYSDDKVNGLTINGADLTVCIKRLKETPLADRAGKFGISKKRAEIIIAGAVMIKSIMGNFGIGSVEVSTNDNMLGYIKKKVYGEGYEREI